MCSILSWFTFLDSLFPPQLVLYLRCLMYYINRLECNKHHKSTADIRNTRDKRCINSLSTWYYKKVWSGTRPCQWGWTEEELRHLSWWGTQPSSDRSHVNTLPCQWQVPRSDSGLFCSSEPVEPPAPSHWSWCSEIVPPTDKTGHLWQCCCTTHRWNKVPCCKHKENEREREFYICTYRIIILWTWLIY